MKCPGSSSRAVRVALIASAFASTSLRAQNSQPAGGLSESSPDAALSPAQVRQALAADRALIASNPQDPARYIDLSYALMDAGMGDLSKAEALRATEVAPQSSLAYSALAWVLHHNSIGVGYAKGCDYHASIAAYRKAIQLAPDDMDVRQALANTLEFNEDGVRYAPDAGLAEAIEIYRYVAAHQIIVEPAVEDNLLYDLFYTDHFKEVVDDTAALSSTPIRDGLAIAAIAASQGGEMAMARANQMSGNPQQRTAALDLAAEGLIERRLYPQAAALLTAGLDEQRDAGQTLRKIQLLRTLKPFHEEDLPDTDPSGPVRRLVSSAILGHLSEAVISANLARHAFSDQDDWQNFLKKSNYAAGTSSAMSIQTGLPAVVMRDIVLGAMKVIVEPSQEPGFRIVVQTVSSPPKRFFVVKEDGVFKLVGQDSERATIGNEALYLLRHGDVAEARSLLNWRRERDEKVADDDPLGGDLFSRLWTTGKSQGTDAIIAAAGSLLADRASSAALLPAIVAMRNKAATARARVDLNLLLARIYITAGDGINAKLTSLKLLDAYPNSATAVELAGEADGLVRDWPAWNAMLQSRLAKHPYNRLLLEQEAEEAEAQGDFSRARQSLRTLLDSGHALAGDYNNYAWLGFFAGPLDAQSTEAAEQANLLNASASFGTLQTLACIYAAQGRTSEARQLLLQAMSAAHLTQPNSEVWFGFGLVYEQYGVSEAAIAAYKKVEKPAGAISPLDTFNLAQARLKALHAD